MAYPAGGALVGDAELEAVTEELVSLHERYHGRRPASARSQIMGDDMLVCLLGDMYTDVEKTMIEMQRQAMVHETRKRVAKFISTHHVGPDLELEIFPLEPPYPGLNAGGTLV